MKEEYRYRGKNSPERTEIIIRTLDPDEYMADAKPWDVPRKIEEEIFDDWLEEQGLRKLERGR